MKRKTKVQTISFFPLLLISMIIIFSGISEAKFLTTSFNNIKNRQDVIVFNFEITTFLNYDFLNSDEFVQSGKIEAFLFSFLYLPENINLTSVTITLTSPSNYVYRHTFESISWKAESNKRLEIPLGDNGFPNKFNESGIWYLEFNFVGETKFTIWEYTGFYPDFSSNSEVRAFSYVIYNHFEKGITVYTQGELVQVRAAKASEDAANQYRFSMYILVISAFISLIAAISAVKGVTISLREKRRESAKYIVKYAINPLIDELKEIDSFYKDLEKGNFYPIPFNISKSNLENSEWKDFFRETHSIIFKYDFKKYLDRKTEYQKIRHTTIEMVEKHIEKAYSHNEHFNKILEKVDITSKIKTLKSNRLFEKIAIAIIEKKPYTKDAYSNHVNLLYNEMWDELLTFRNKDDVKNQLDKLSKIVNKLKIYKSLLNDIKNLNRWIVDRFNLTFYEMTEKNK